MGAIGQLTWGNAFGPDQEVYTTLTSVSTTAESIGLNLKEADRGDGWNWIEICYQPALSTVQIWTVHNWGTWLQHGSDIPVTFQAGDQFGARVRADGTVGIYKNGILVGSAQVSTAWPARSEGGRVGVWLLHAGTTSLNSFGGGSMP